MKWSLESALASYVQSGDRVIVGPLSPYRPGLSSERQSQQRQGLLLHLGLGPTEGLNQRDGWMGAKPSSSQSEYASQSCVSQDPFMESVPTVVPPV